MKNFLKTMLLLSMMGCASQTLPPSGDVSPFDGQWNGEAVATSGGCSRLSIDGEVRFGSFLATLRADGRAVGEVWGSLNPAGTINGSIGAAGVNAGSTQVTFSGTDASGIWSARGCSGSLTLSKQQ